MAQTFLNGGVAILHAGQGHADARLVVKLALPAHSVPSDIVPDKDTTVVWDLPDVDASFGPQSHSGFPLLPAFRFPAP